MRKKALKKAQIPKEVSLEWFDRLVRNSMMMPVVLRRIARLERCLRRLDPEHKGKTHILVWRDVGGIGDIVMQSAIAKGLKQMYPNSYITYQVPERYLAIPKHNPYVDEVQIVETPFLDDGFDKAVKLSNPCPAAVYESVKEPHIVKGRIDLFLETAGIKTEDRSLVYKIQDDERKWAKGFLKKHDALDTVRIGFQVRSAEERRDWEGWKELAELVHRNIKNSKIFIFDHNPRMAWQDKKVINVCGFKIADVVAVIEGLDLIIGSDSGLLHLAGALGTKILGLFGPTNPYFRLNTYNASWIWLNEKFKCMPCLPPDMLILSYGGICEIKDLKQGDKVLTHTGEFRHVTEVMRRQYTGELISIYPLGTNMPIKVTPEHPILSIKAKRCSNREWMPAGELERGDFVVLPKVSSQKSVEKILISDYVRKDTIKNRDRIPFKKRINIPNTIHIDKNFLRLAGFYIAEGNIERYGRIRFTFDNKEEDYVKEVIGGIKRIFNLDARLIKRGTFIQIEICSKIIGEFLKELFGERESKKHFPAWFLELDKQLIGEFIQTMWYGDGCNSTWTYSTISTKLAYQLRTVLFKFGIMSQIMKRHRKVTFKGKTGDFTIYRIIISESDIEKIQCILGLNMYQDRIKKPRYWMDESYVYLPISRITKETYKGLVYNLEVNIDHSYVCNNVAVHNCWYAFDCGDSKCMKAITPEMVLEKLERMLG